MRLLWFKQMPLPAVLSAYQTSSRQTYTAFCRVNQVSRAKAEPAIREKVFAILHADFERIARC